jgi:hypothetical protein
MSTIKEFLANNPDPKARDIQGLETNNHLRVLSGGPPLTGPTDVDGVGVQRWQTVIYASGDDPWAPLDFVHRVLLYKVSKGYLPHMPNLVLHLPDGGFQGPLHQPWHLGDAADSAASNLPKPFAACPPRGRRHVLAMLEKEEIDENTQYTFCVYGGIYVFRSRFDELKIAAGDVPLDATTQIYVRFVKFAGLDDGETHLTSVLEGCLLRLPIYFMNRTGQDDDEVAQWILEQPGVMLSAADS